MYKYKYRYKYKYGSNHLIYDISEGERVQYQQQNEIFLASVTSDPEGVCNIPFIGCRCERSSGNFSLDLRNYSKETTALLFRTTVEGVTFDICRDLRGTDLESLRNLSNGTKVVNPPEPDFYYTFYNNLYISKPRWSHGNKVGFRVDIYAVPV